MIFLINRMFLINIETIHKKKKNFGSIKMINFIFFFCNKLRKTIISFDFYII
jgi:hypothetical protein